MGGDIGYLTGLGQARYSPNVTQEQDLPKYCGINGYLFASGLESYRITIRGHI